MLFLSMKPPSSNNMTVSSWFIMITNPTLLCLQIWCLRHPIGQFAQTARFWVTLLILAILKVVVPKVKPWRRKIWDQIYAIELRRRQPPMLHRRTILHLPLLMSIMLMRMHSFHMRLDPHPTLPFSLLILGPQHTCAMTNLTSQFIKILIHLIRSA